MAISQKTLSALLVSLKIYPDEAAATKAITDTEEHAVALGEGVEVMNKDEKTTFGNNNYKNGTAAGLEMWLKQTVEKELPEFTGSKKDPEAVIAALVDKGHKSANVAPDEKIKERDKTIGSLRDTLKSMEAQAKESDARMLKKEREAQLLTWTIEKKPENFTNAEWLALIGMSNEVVEEDGKLFIKRGGEFVKDKLQSNIPAEQAVLSWIDERKIGKVVAPGGGGPAGRGGKDSAGSTNGIRTMKQFEALCAEKGWDLKSSYAQTELNRISGENKDFDFAN